MRVGNAVETSAEFTGELGRTYAFYSISTDNVGHVEEPPHTPDAATTTRTVVGRHIVYNQSYFDGNDPAAGANDDNAIATDKSALLPNGVATFANYTSYSLGINAIMVDIDRLPDPAALEARGADSFAFHVGNTNDPSTWSAGPAPTSVTVREGEGVDGSDRVTLIWENNTIQKQWLQVTIKTDDVTGLAVPDVFYFGNAVGESGNSTTNTFVDGSDFAARDNPHNFLDRAPVDCPCDYNRDSFVDGTDMAIARDHSTNFQTALRLLDLSGAGSPAPASMFEESSPLPLKGRGILGVRAEPSGQPFVARLDKKETVPHVVRVEDAAEAHANICDSVFAREEKDFLAVDLNGFFEARRGEEDTSDEDEEYKDVWWMLYGQQ